MNAAFLLVTTAWLAGDVPPAAGAPVAAPAPAAAPISAPVTSAPIGGSCGGSCGAADCGCCQSEGFLGRCKHRLSGLFNRGSSCGCDSCGSSCNTCNTCNSCDSGCGRGHGGLFGGRGHGHQSSCGCDDGCGSSRGGRLRGLFGKHHRNDCCDSCNSCGGCASGACGGPVGPVGPSVMPKAGEQIPPSSTPPKEMPKGAAPTTGAAPVVGGEPPAAVAAPAPAITPDLSAPVVPSAPADLDRKDPF